MNPYESSTAEATRKTEPPTVVDNNKVARYAQVGLRLLGVMFVVDGIGGLFGSCVYAAVNFLMLRDSDYDVFTDWYVAGWFASSVSSLILGLYFVIGGRKVIELVFLPAHGDLPAIIDNDAPNP